MIAKAVAVEFDVPRDLAGFHWPMHVDPEDFDILRDNEAGKSTKRRPDTPRGYLVVSIANNGNLAADATRLDIGDRGMYEIERNGEFKTGPFTHEITVGKIPVGSELVVRAWTLNSLPRGDTALASHHATGSVPIALPVLVPRNEFERPRPMWDGVPWLLCGMMISGLLLIIQKTIYEPQGTAAGSELNRGGRVEP